MASATNAVLTLLLVLLAGAALSHDDTSPMDSARAVKVPVALRVCFRFDDSLCDGDCYAKARILKVLKNETSTQFGDFVELSYRSSGPQMREGITTVYLREKLGSAWALDEQASKCVPGWSDPHPEGNPYPSPQEIEEKGGYCPHYTHLEKSPLCDPTHPDGPLAPEVVPDARRITSP